MPFDQQILLVQVISQGSILGPILYANYVSAIFDIADLFNFADDNYVHDRASAWFRYKWLVTCLENQARVCTPICQSLM